MDIQNARSLAEQRTAVHPTIFSDEAYRLAAIGALLRSGTVMCSPQRNVDAALDLVLEAYKRLYEIEHYGEIRFQDRSKTP
jgi:hypothetical protein